MAISMYLASVPVFQKYLANLDHILDKAAADLAARKIDFSVLLQSRLAPDMFALTRQIQITCDFAKFCPARLSGIEAPKFEDNETTLAEIKARIRKTQDFLATVKPAQIDGSEERVVNFKAGPREMSFKGLDYLTTYALPNFFFHLSTAYAILRHNGVPLGKGDFIAGRQV